MLRQTMTEMLGVFSQRGIGAADPRETRVAQIIAVSFGVLWAVTIGLTALNGQ
jgi:hypothetical protein